MLLLVLKPVINYYASLCRCAEPAAEGVFANFSLLLTEDPVEEPDVVDLGTVYQEDRTKFPSITGSEDENDKDIHWDNRLHFSIGEKEVDILKNLRDIAGCLLQQHLQGPVPRLRREPQHEQLQLQLQHGGAAGQGNQAAGNSQRPAEAYAEKMMMRQTVHMQVSCNLCDSL